MNVRKLAVVMAALVAGAVLGNPHAAIGAAEKIDAQNLIRKVETQYQGDTSHAIMRMTIRTEDYTRELKLEAWGRGREDFLARIREPKKEAGISTLKVGDDIWNYLPKIDRVMQVPSSLMGEGWMGSHFTNDDLVKESKIDQLYSFETLYADAATVAVEASPRPDAAVVWGKLIYEVDRKKLVPIEVRYFDEDGTPVRRLSFADVRKVSGRWVAMRLKVQPLEDPDESTEVVYEELEFGVPLGDERFSLRALRAR